MVPPGFLGVEWGVPTVPNITSVNAKGIHPQLILGEDDYGIRLDSWVPRRLFSGKYALQLEGLFTRYLFGASQFSEYVRVVWKN